VRAAPAEQQHQNGRFVLILQTVSAIGKLSLAGPACVLSKLVVDEKTGVICKSCDLHFSSNRTLTRGPVMANLTVESTETTATASSTAAPADDATQSIHSHAGAAFFCGQLKEVYNMPRPRRILVAGCGAGHEAAAIQQHTGSEMEAVDVEPFFAEAQKLYTNVNYQVASVCELPFEDGAFDAIFYHHVIEHVDDPPASLVELRRVISDDGVLFIGTPNRNRIFSSIGAHTQSEWESTIWNKVKDNLQDWRDRCCGTFRNECGAHAGFTRKELDGLTAKHFSQRRWVTAGYLRFKYNEHRLRSLFHLATKRPMCEVLAPSVYVFCQV